MATTRGQITLELIADASKAVNGLRQVGGGLQQIGFRLNQLTGGQFKYNASLNRFTDSSGNFVSAAKVMKVAAQTLEVETRDYQEALAAATAGLTDHQRKLLQSAGIINQNAHATGSAQFAAISLGQTFQDMGQFGMGAAQGVRAITNNVQQFVQSMVMLKGQIGPGKSVFAALKTSLTGPVGLLAAFSLVTAGIEFFSNKMQQAKSAANDLGEAFSETFDAISPIAGRVSLSLEELARRESILSDAIRQRRAEVKEMRTSAIRQQQIYGFVSDALSEQIRKEKALLDLDKAMLASIQDSIDGYESQTDAIKRSIELFGDEGIERSAVARVTAELTQENFKLREEYALLSVANDTEIEQLREQNRQLERQISLRSLMSGGDFGQDSGLLYLFNILGGPMRDKPKEFYEDLQRGAEMSAANLHRLSLEAEKAWLNFFPDLEDIDLDLGDPLAPFIDMTRVSVMGIDGITNMLDFSVMSYSDMVVKMREEGQQLSQDLARFASEYDREQARIAAANERLASSFDRMGADFIMSVAAMSGGMDQFIAQFGSFLERWGKQLVLTGIAETAFGEAMARLKAAISTPGGALLAIGAGIALAAAGRVLAKRARASANPGSSSLGGGSRGVSSAPTFFTGFGNVSDIPGSSITPPITSANRRTQSVEFTVVGRNLVGVLDNNAQASQRVTGRNMVVGAAGSSTGGGITPILEF